MAKINEENLAKLMYKSNKSLTKSEWQLFGNMIQHMIISLVKSGKTVKLSKFGTFTPKVHKGRVSRNPQTKEKINIPDIKVVKFKPARHFRSIVRGND